MQLSRTNLTCAVQAGISSLEFLYGSRFELRIEWEIIALADFSAIQRIVENLGSNAIKYGDPDRPIRVSLYRAPNEIRLEVHNFGKPIAREDLPGLFDAFYRSHTAVVGAQPGWGLGLTLVKGLSESLGGKVHVKSDPESGTQFTLVLPSLPAAIVSG